MAQNILVERDGPVATITLNRIESHNALTAAMLTELESVARSLVHDEQTRAVILCANGKHFSVGADLDELSGLGEAGLLALRRKAELGGRMMHALQNVPQPVICAIQGVATGGATCIATACDFRVASRDARIGYGEVKLGINLMWNAVPPCVHLVGPSRAKQLIMSGELFDAQKMEGWGMVDEICDPEALAAHARSWAEQYVALPPIAVQMIKRSVNRVSSALDEAIMHADSDQWLLSTLTEDFQEAIAAFREKREPEFRGS